MQLATLDIDSVYIDDMGALASLYNGEFGTPQTLFFHHARAMLQNKCLDPQRMLHGYVKIDFLERDLYAMLGQETNKVLLQFTIDRTHIPAIGHPDFVRQTTLRNNRQLWRAYGTTQQRFWTAGNGNEYVAPVEDRPAHLEAFFQEIRGRFRCNVSEYLVKMNALRSLPGESAQNLFIRFDEYASAIENDGAYGWISIALKFLNALLVKIYAAMKGEWEDEERRRGSANPLIPAMSRAKIRTMALSYENTMAIRPEKFRAPGLDPARLLANPPVTQPYQRPRPPP